MAPIFQDETPSSRRLTRKDHAELRSMYGGDDVRAHHGMGVKKPRRMSVRHRPEESDPASQFLYNDGGTQAFLLKNFPYLQTDSCQKLQAARWAAIIYHYFRLGWVDSRIERELDWGKGEVGSIVQQIRRKIKGLRRNGKPYSQRKRGRPRKVVVLSVAAPPVVQAQEKRAA
jgi:hypothetical protein